jgi:hypothetical protein
MKQYTIRYLEVCEDLSNLNDTITYAVTVGDESPVEGSPDDTSTGYHFDPTEWGVLVATLERGERYPFGNDLSCLDGHVVSVQPHATCVTVYSIELCCGGNEEGGWYYTWYTPLFTVPLVLGVSAEEQVEQAKEKARNAHGAVFAGDVVNTGYGDRQARSHRSASPEVDAVAMTEEVALENQSTERPRYE